MAELQIPRDEWLQEMKERSPSPDAFEAYVELETFVVEHTALKPTYRRNLSGDAKYATFNGSAMGRLSVIQIFNGRCELIWKWTKAIPGTNEEQHQAINESLDRFRKSLGGTDGKRWEKVMVIGLGIDRVEAAVLAVSRELLEILDGGKS